MTPVGARDHPRTQTDAHAVQGGGHDARSIEVEASPSALDLRRGKELSLASVARNQRSRRTAPHPSAP